MNPATVPEAVEALRRMGVSAEVVPHVLVRSPGGLTLLASLREDGTWDYSGPWGPRGRVRFDTLIGAVQRMDPPTTAKVPWTRQEWVVVGILTLGALGCALLGYLIAAALA